MAYRLLKEALGREFGLVEMPRIAWEEKGKPYFPEYPHIYFNLSHSCGAAVCALHHLPIGVDVESMRPAPKRLAEGRSDLDFFRWWTGREATIKRRGERWTALLRDEEPDEGCLWLENLLPGCIVAVCPSEDGTIRTVRINVF